MNENTAQYVYCMSNPSLPEDMLKIGWTKEHPQKRADDLYTSGIPSPFVVEFIIITPDGLKCEKIIHEHLNTYRVNPGREFFKISLNKLTEILENELKFELTPIPADMIYRKKNYNDHINKLKLLYENLEKEHEEYFSKFKKEKAVMVIREQNNKKYVSFRDVEYDSTPLHTHGYEESDEERHLRDVEYDSTPLQTSCHEESDEERHLKEAYYFINRDINDYKVLLEQLIYSYKHIKETIGGRQMRSDNALFKNMMLKTQKNLHNIRSEYVVESF